MNTLKRKILMSLTGLFLCFFLVIHFLGNLQLFLPAEQAQLSFNAYSHFLSGNILIKVVSILLYTCILGHVIDAFWIGYLNRKAAGKFKKDARQRASKWYRRHMGLLGFAILLFLILHFQNFWYYYKFGEIGLDSEGHKDLYSLVITAFQDPLIVVVYVLGMVSLFYHLIHGLQSAVRTLGLYHQRYAQWLQVLGYAYAWIICLGFTLIPIYIFFTH